MFVRDRRERIFPCHAEGTRTPIRAYEPPACRQFDFEEVPRSSSYHEQNPQGYHRGYYY